MTPITIPPPVWTEKDTHLALYSARVGSIMLRVGILFDCDWDVRIRYADFYDRIESGRASTVAEAQSAAWAALSRWLGVAL